MAYIKYREGYMAVIGFGSESSSSWNASKGVLKQVQPVIPTPYMFWDEHDTSLILPLAMVFSVAWSLEM